MNILFITHRYPHPLNRGDRIRSFNMLQYMAKFGDVTLATLYDEAPSEASQNTLASLCREVIAVPWRKYWRWCRAGRSMLAGKTATEGIFYDRELKKRLKILAKKEHFDAIVIFCSSMYPYLSIFQEVWEDSSSRETKRPRIVVDLVDVDSQKWFDYAKTSRFIMRQLFQTEGTRLRRLETRIADTADAILVVTDEEVNLYRSFCDYDNIHAISNGVDTEVFNPDAPELRNISQQPRRCVFVGAMDYRANVDGVRWFLKEVWPAIRREFPDAEYDIVGSNPSDAFRREAEELPGVNVTGAVPDVRPYLKRASVSAICLRVARGIQNKVLESLAMQRATVVSPHAAEGIELERGHELIVCQSPEEWISAISDLFRNDALRYKLGEEGRRLVEGRYAWVARLDRLKSILVAEE